MLKYNNFMDYLFWGQIGFILLVAVGGFIFWTLVRYWRKKLISEIIVPAIYIFPFFLLAFFAFFLIAVFLQYNANPFASV